jgi:TonB-dependent siderophore receptor
MRSNVSSGEVSVKQMSMRAIVIAALLSSASSQAWAQNTNSGTSDEASDDQDIVVEGRLRFRESETDSALKLTLPVKEVPQSVTVVTEDVIEFAAIRKFDDIYKIDASAGTSNRLDEFPTGFYRGFATQGQNALRIDGFRFVGNIDLDLNAFERFEVVKGPTSALYGQNTIGGALNAVLKKPTSEAGGEIEVGYGSFNTFRASLDYGGALNESGTVRARLIAAFSDGDSHIDVIKDRNILLAPSLAFDLGEKTAINLNFIYQHSKGKVAFGTGLQVLADGSLSIPIDPATGQEIPRSFFSGADYTTNVGEAKILFASLTHKFDDQWRVRILGQYSTLDRTPNSFGQFSYVDQDGFTDGCCAYLRDDKQDLYGAEINLIGDFEAFGNDNTLFIGADYSKQKGRRFNRSAYVTDTGVFTDDSGDLPGFNIFTTPRDIARPTRSDFYFYSEGVEAFRYAGITGQMLLQPIKGLKFLLAGRYSFDRIESNDRSASGFGTAEGELPTVPFDQQIVEKSKFVPQIGVTYGVSKDVNIYANWGKTFELQTARFSEANGGGILPPEEGEQYEAGVKAELLNRKLNLSAAIFQITRSNISAPDPDDNDFSIAIGNQRSKGIEFSANGSITPAWNIFFSAAIIDAEFRSGELAGFRPVNTAKFATSIFSSYEILDGPMKGLGFGAGYVFKNNADSGSSGPDDDFVSFNFGKVNELSLNLFYNTDDWSINANLSNITNDKFYSPAFNGFSSGINVNPGRNFSISVARKF